MSVMPSQNPLARGVDILAMASTKMEFCCLGCLTQARVKRLPLSDIRPAFAEGRCLCARLETKPWNQLLDPESGIAELVLCKRESRALSAWLAARAASLGGVERCFTAFPETGLGAVYLSALRMLFSQVKYLTATKKGSSRGGHNSG